MAVHVIARVAGPAHGKRGEEEIDVVVAAATVDAVSARGAALVVVGFAIHGRDVYFWPCAHWYSLRLTERRRKNAKPSPRDVVNDRGNRSRRF